MKFNFLPILVLFTIGICVGAGSLLLNLYPIGYAYTANIIIGGVFGIVWPPFEFRN